MPFNFFCHFQRFRGTHSCDPAIVARMIAVASENTCGDQQLIPVSEGLDLQQLLQENRALNCEKNYYKSMHERAVAREELLKQENQQLNARIDTSKLPSDLVKVVAVWPELPEHIKAAIKALIQAHDTINRTDYRF